MRSKSSHAVSSPRRQRDTRFESGSKIRSSRLRCPGAEAFCMALPDARFSNAPKTSVAVAMALALSLTETRLYHDRFNLSGMPEVSRQFRHGDRHRTPNVEMDSRNLRRGRHAVVCLPPVVRGGSFRLAPVPRYLGQIALGVGGGIAGPGGRNLLWARAALGGVPQAAQAPALVPEPALGHRGGLHGARAFRPGRRVRPALSDCN